MRMPNKKQQYDLVINDELDSRIPLYPDEAFAKGINFSAKYIGTLDVPRPTSKIEIVAAMRRIRYEFKAKAIKKKKVSIEVSVEGIRVLLRKKKKKALPPNGSAEEARLLVMTHPIYRIFYVSHDSQDLKIFSYIARDASSNIFRCSVFKAAKKGQAMRIVRTVGQAFEVCHKYGNTVKETRSPSPTTNVGDDSDDSAHKRKKEEDLESSQGDQMTLTSEDPCDDSLASSRIPQISASPSIDNSASRQLSNQQQTSNDLTLRHQLKLVSEQYEQQQQQTQLAVAQVHLLRDKLAAETAARLEAQARTHQLLLHNKELLEHIQALVVQLKEKDVTPTRLPPTPSRLPSAVGASSGSATPSSAPMQADM